METCDGGCGDAGCDGGCAGLPSSLLDEVYEYEEEYVEAPSYVIGESFDRVRAFVGRTIVGTTCDCADSGNICDKDSCCPGLFSLSPRERRERRRQRRQSRRNPDTSPEGLWDTHACEEVRCSKLYCGLFGGYNEVEEFDFLSGGDVVQASFNDGYVVGAVVGRQMTPCLRAEVEYSFRTNRGDDFIVNAVPGNWSGDFSLQTYMVNALLDVKPLQLGCITPYVGGGVGYADFDADMRAPTGDLQVQGRGSEVAYQGIAGATIRVNGKLDLFGEYRYMWMKEEVDIVDSTGATIASQEPEFTNIMLGVRFYR